MTPVPDPDTADQLYVQERAALCEERFEIWWSSQYPAWAGLPITDRVTVWEQCRASWYAAWSDADVSLNFRTYVSQKKSREPSGRRKKKT